jgi:mannosyltransferase
MEKVFLLTDKKKTEKFFLFAVLILALVLRLIGMQSRPIWYDDAFSVFLSRQSFADIISGTAVDTAPPLYYFLLHYWMALGQQVWFLRSLNIILGLVILILAYLWVSKLIGIQEALLTGLFIAVSPVLIYHAQELRMYTLLVLSLIGYFLFLTRIWKSGGENRYNWFNWVGVIIFGVLSMYSHNLAIFYLVAPNFFFMVNKQRRHIFWQLLLAQLLVFILSIPWLLLLPKQIDKIQTAFYTPRPGLVEIYQVIIIFHTNMPLPPTLLYIAAIVSIQILAVVIIEILRVGTKDENLLFLAYVTILPMVMIIVASYLMRPLFVSRALIPSAVAYYAIVAYTVVRARDRRIGILLGMAFVLLSLIALPNYYSYASFPRSPFQQASHYLQSRIEPGDVILHDDKLSYFPVHFYAPDLPQSFLPDEPGSHNDTLALASQDAMGIYPVPDLESAISQSSRVWFVVFQKAIDEYLAAGYEDHQVISRLKSNFDLIEIEEIRDLHIYAFSR